MKVKYAFIYCNVSIDHYNFPLELILFQSAALKLN